MASPRVSFHSQDYQLGLRFEILDFRLLDFFTRPLLPGHPLPHLLFFPFRPDGTRVDWEKRIGRCTLMNTSGLKNRGFFLEF